MEITFDEHADALYIRFQSRKRSSRTVKLRDGVLVDIDRSGRLFGIEILDATHRIPIGQLSRVHTNLPIHT